MLNRAVKNLCIYHILDGLRIGLSHFSGPSRAALLFAEKPDDPMRIYDPQELLRGHEPKLERLASKPSASCGSGQARGSRSRLPEHMPCIIHSSLRCSRPGDSCSENTGTPGTSSELWWWKRRAAGAICSTWAASATRILAPPLLFWIHWRWAAQAREENPDYQLLDFEPPREVARILFPRLRVAEGSARFNIVWDMKALGEEVVVSTNEDLACASVCPTVLFHFSAGLKLNQADLGDGYYPYLLRKTGRRERMSAEEHSGLQKVRYLTEPAGWLPK